MAISKNGQVIADLDMWGRVAGPKSDNHWVDNRSAKETARFWLDAGDTLPSILAGPLVEHPSFGTVVTWSGEPEVKLAFDRRKGEPRNTDLLLHCSDEHGSFLVAVEAKADEPFGETVAEALAAALERRLDNARSRGIERVVDLAGALLGPKGEKQSRINDLRYQLMTGIAGALAEGVRLKVQRVVFAIQEFQTDATSDANHKANQADLDAFTHRMTKGEVATVPSGKVLGPFAVPGVPLFEDQPELFLLKMTSNIRTK